MGEQTIPEPPDGGYALIGAAPDQKVVVRDDVAAEEARRDLSHGWVLAVDARWWDVADDADPPVPWSRIARPGAVVQRLYTHDEVCDLVAQAVAVVAVIPVGDGLIDAEAEAVGGGSR